MVTSCGCGGRVIFGVGGLVFRLHHVFQAARVMILSFAAEPSCARARVGPNSWARPALAWLVSRIVAAPLNNSRRRSRSAKATHGGEVVGNERVLKSARTAAVHVSCA